MNNAADLGLTHSELGLINEVISKEPLVYKAVVFGSRAKGNYKKYSDIDIALFGDLTDSNASRTELELEELPVIYQFDVIAYNHLKNQKLKEHIDRVGVVFYEREVS